MRKLTNIAVRPETKERLRRLKVHPRQSFEEVILMLLERMKDEGGDGLAH